MADDGQQENLDGGEDAGEQDQNNSGGGDGGQGGQNNQQDILDIFDALEEDEKDGDKDEDDDSELGEEESKALDKALDRKLAPIISKQATIEKVDEFLNSDAGAKYRPFAKQIKEVAVLPQGRGWKPVAIARAVAGDKLEKAAGKEGEEAAQRAKAGDNGGNTARNNTGGGPVNAWELNPEQWQQAQQDIMNGNFKM